MSLRKILVPAAMFAILGVDPFLVDAAIRTPPVRKAVLNRRDHPHYLLIPVGHGRKVLILKRTARKMPLV